MSIRATAQIAEETAVQLANKGRGLFGRRERHAERIIGEFVGAALDVPPGGVLPREIRTEVSERIERAIAALETYVARTGRRSSRRVLHDSGVVQRIYALREAQQNILQTRHM